MWRGVLRRRAGRVAATRVPRLGPRSVVILAPEDPHTTQRALGIAEAQVSATEHVMALAAHLTRLPRARRQGDGARHAAQAQVGLREAHREARLLREFCQPALQLLRLQLRLMSATM